MSIEGLDTGGLPVDVLDGIDPAGLSGAEVVDFARDCFRARNRATARLLTALHEAGRTEDGQKGRRALLDEFSGDEAAAALGWSRAMACRWLDLADDLRTRLPEVHAAMRGGQLEDTKARVLSDWTRDLADDHAHHVCTEVLPEAPRLPVAALIERIQQLAAALDPDWAARREQAATRRARVLASRNPTGTANLSGLDLPLERAAVSMARLEALAARLRRRGVPTRIEALRAEVYLTLLDGTAAGLDDDTLLDLLADRLTPPDQPDDPDDPDEPDDPPPPPGPDDSGPDGGPENGGPGDAGPDDAGSDDAGSDDAGSDDVGGSGVGGLGDSEPGDDSSDGSGDESGDESGDGSGEDPDDPGHRDPSHRDPGHRPDDEPRGTPDETPSDDAPGDDAPSSGAAPGPVVRDGTLEVRLRLSTALGLDELPAQIPRWGTALAPTARSLLARYHHGEWRIVLTDDTGRLRHLLLARHRPHLSDTSPPPGRPPRPRRDRRRGRHRPAIVELQVPTTLLAALDPADHPAWAPLLTELHRRLPELDSTGEAHPPDEHLDPAAATHRRPTTEIDRWVRARDRRCIAPSCREPAHATDLDHTTDHAHGGPTLSRNLGALCRHHHRAKHHGRWHLTQPAPGRFLITTRAGATYETLPPRITDPLPNPRPAATPRPLPPDLQPDGHHHDDPDLDDVRDPFWRPPHRPGPVPHDAAPHDDGDARNPAHTARPPRTPSLRDLLRQARRAARDPQHATEPTAPDPDPPPF